jgi:dihydrofolate synthase/folylpolyglutamate synthase
LNAAALCERMPSVCMNKHDDVVAALEAATAIATADDRLLAFGSFHVAGPALQWARDHGYPNGEQV